MTPITPLDASALQPGQSPAASPGSAADFHMAMTEAVAAGTDNADLSLEHVVAALTKVNQEAQSLGDAAAAAEAHSDDLSPGEMVMLTMRCNEFLFDCQLTSNIANRSADGVQQLFQQQA